MAIYSKTTKQMMIDLINEGNPQLPFPINLTDFEFTLPEVIADPGNGHNTRIRISAKPNTDYVGNVVLTYRRLNIANIFRNMTLEIERWLPQVGSQGSVWVQLRELLPIYSEKYGFNFNPTEWTDRGLTGYNAERGDTFPITPVSTNLAFIGSVNAKWHLGERTLESLLPVDVVSGRRFPGGNNFTIPVDHKYWVTPDGFDLDHSANKDILEGHYLTANVNSFIGQTGGGYNEAISAFLNSCMSRVRAREHEKNVSYTYNRFYTGSLLDNANSPSVGVNVKVGGLNGCLIKRYVLPHAAVPEANSEFYNRCVVVEIPSSSSWGTGRLFFHYNV